MFTKSQRKVLEMLSNGVDWKVLSDDEVATLHHLEELGPAGARVDIADDLWLLTEKGKAVLQELQTRDEQAKKEADKQAEEKAEQKREKRSERRFRIMEPFLAALIGAVFTNLDRIITILVEWLPRIWAAIWK